MSSVLNDGSLKQDTLFERWNIHHRVAHIGIYASFILCAATGLPIKYHTKGWAQSFAAFFGGGDGLLSWHLFAGFVCFAAAFYHLAHMIIAGPVLKQWSMGVVPVKKDITDLIDHLRYQVGASNKPAQFDRYSYKEKFDYWAVFWGMAIIGGSGLMMWLPEWTMQYFPRWILDSYRMGHSDEAVLAVLVIFIWHFFNVHFNPDFFPMSWTWWDGKMSYEVMKHEHPVELGKILAREETHNKKTSINSSPPGEKENISS